MLENYWWIQDSFNEDADTDFLVRTSVRERYKSYNDLRRVLWKWYRVRAGYKHLSASAKLVLYAVVERFRWETWSSHDAYRYYAKMTGLTPKTVGRCVDELVADKILVIAVEGEHKLLKKARSGVRKHLLLRQVSTLLGE